VFLDYCPDPYWIRAHCSRVYLSYHFGVPTEWGEVFRKCCPYPTWTATTVLLKTIPILTFRSSCLEYCTDPYLDNSLLLKTLPFTMHSGVPAERQEVFCKLYPYPYLDTSLLFKTLPFNIQEVLQSNTRCSASFILIPTWTRA
jgi:hypothetical protein